MKFKNYLSLLFIFIATVVSAQTVEINGKVTDAKTQMPISGVNIKIKNTTKGVATDIDGNFTIKIPTNETLVFSIVGYEHKEVKINNQQKLNIELSEEENKLQEVVVNVGYGTQKKKFLTSAVSTVKADAFEDRPIYNVGQAIQGNAAGVYVVQPSGKPGVGININIRGLNSVESGVNPLFVIDGVQTYDSSGINTEDIVDIQILKDATSTAIYGVNGSSGVIIITTRKGKANTNVFNFNTYYGTSKIVKNIDVLNLDQYKNLMGSISSSYLNDANNPLYTGINTNWVNEVFQQAQDKNVDFSYTGGTEKIKAFTSLGYQATEGIVNPSNFNRLSGKVNLDAEVNSWMKAHAYVTLIHTTANNTSDNNNANAGGVILSALTTPAFLPAYSDQLNRIDPTTGLPYTTIYDNATNSYNDGYKDGQFTPNPTASLENPVSFQSRQDMNESYRYLGNLGFDVTLAKNLVWKPTSTYETTRNVWDYFVDSYRSNYGRNNNNSDITLRGLGKEHIVSNSSWNLENTLNYSLIKGDNNFNFLVGGSYQKYKFQKNQIEGTGFPLELRELDLSQMMVTTVADTYEVIREKNYVSYFGRLTYNLKDKYIVNGVFRATGASQLAENHKWGYFPGISGAWVISNENFLKESKSISELKLRGGWGQTGNIQSLNEYAWYSLLPENASVNVNSTQNAVNYENQDLTWETTSDLDLGIDVGLLKNRVKLSADVYKRVTDNLLNTFPINGVNFLYNAGKLENKGLELTLNTINLEGAFTWTTNFNISFIQIQMLEMGVQPVNYYGYGGVNRVEVNQPLGNFYGFVVDRVNPTNGILEYKDVNGDGLITGADRTIIGNALPDYTFGFTNNFSYKGFNLDIMFTGSEGNDIFNASRIDLEGMLNSKNQSVAVLDRWTTPGQVTDIPIAGQSNFNGISSVANSSRWVEDGSYIRLKAATLGYDFKKSFLGISSLKLYVTGQNIITWTKYTGFDPEVSSTNNNNGTGMGIDYGTYPQVKTLIFGLKARF